MFLALPALPALLALPVSMDQLAYMVPRDEWDPKGKMVPEESLVCLERKETKATLVQPVQMDLMELMVHPVCLEETESWERMVNQGKMAAMAVQE